VIRVRDIFGGATRSTFFQEGEPIFDTMAVLEEEIIPSTGTSAGSSERALYRALGKCQLRQIGLPTKAGGRVGEILRTLNLPRLGGARGDNENPRIVPQGKIEIHTATRYMSDRNVNDKVSARYVYMFDIRSNACREWQIARTVLIRDSGWSLILSFRANGTKRQEKQSKSTGTWAHERASELGHGGTGRR
jgi:hypothetical protein